VAPSSSIIHYELLAATSINAQNELLAPTSSNVRDEFNANLIISSSTRQDQIYSLQCRQPRACGI
jgi:hypothetical protein